MLAACPIWQADEANFSGSLVEARQTRLPTIPRYATLVREKYRAEGSMMPKLERMLLGIVAAVCLSAPLPSLAADHRDAPTVDDYSAIDINDVFMFRDPPCNAAPCASKNLVMVLSTQAVANPKFGPSYHFQSNALYRFNFSTTPTAIKLGKPTASIDVVFSPFGNNPSCPAPRPLCQTFRVFFPDNRVVEGPVTQGTANATPNQPVVTRIVTPQGPIKVFAGPREDPFFFDLVGFNRFIADFNSQTTKPAVPHFDLFTGVDSFLGSNINAIVLEFPIRLLLPAGSTKLAAWAVTFLGDLRDPDDSHQIDRMGNPAVNTALISAPLKDSFNFGIPQNDARDFGKTIAATAIRYGVNQTTVLPALATAAIPDTLKFDTKLADTYLQVPPNGRQLGDRTTDFLLSLLFNVQGPNGSKHPKGVICPKLAETSFSDCTKPKKYLAEFPFAGPPLQQTP
jgi:hypothetical protein